MKKGDLKKLALMGITGGVMLASQGAVAAADASATVMLAAGSCGGGSYAPSGSGYYPSSGSYSPSSGGQSSCGGGTYNSGRGSSGSYSPNGGGYSQSSCGGGTYSGARGSSGNYVPETGMDEGSVSTDDQPAGIRNQPTAQPSSGCAGRSSCNGISRQPQQNQQQNQPYQAPQQMMPQNPSGMRNTPSANGSMSYQDTAAKRADMNNR